MYNRRYTFTVRYWGGFDDLFTKEKNVFHDGNAQGGIWFLCGNKSLYLLNIPAIIYLFYQKT